jgi:hypothetical protein
MRDIVIEFLSFEGCPHAPVLRQRLDEALQALGMTVTPVLMDLLSLCEASDLRSGFGSPTILVNGRDLFGMDCPPLLQDPACRIYRPVLPSTTDVLEKLRDRLSDSG